MKQVRFLRPTTIFGRDYGAGAHAELDDQMADALQTCGIVALPANPLPLPAGRSGRGHRENASLNSDKR